MTGKQKLHILALTVVHAVLGGSGVLFALLLRSVVDAATGHGASNTRESTIEFSLPDDYNRETDKVYLIGEYMHSEEEKAFTDYASEPLEIEIPEDVCLDHSFTYSAEGAAITATCSETDCTLKDSKATLTIVAPAGELVYDGSEKAAVIGGDIGVLGAPTIRYQKKSGDTWDAETTASPTDAGTYKASVTLGEGDGAATASVEYAIAQTAPSYTVPTGLSAAYGQTLADVSLTDHAGWAWADAATSVGSVGEHTFKAAFTPSDTVNYYSVSDIDVTVTVVKAANPATVTSIAAVTRDGKSVDLSANVSLNGATGAVSYEIVGEAEGCTMDGGKQCYDQRPRPGCPATSP